MSFGGWFAFHNYNEPLANPRIADEIAFVQRHLPQCRPVIYSNGDLLSRASFESLNRAGLKHLRVTRYPTGDDIRRDPDEGAIRRWLRRTGFDSDGTWPVEPGRQGLVARGTDRGTTIEVISPDIEGTYNWRGGTALAIQPRRRAEPCGMTATSAVIDFRGKFKMCCNVVSDAASHDRYIVGDSSQRPFSVLWNDPKMQEWRLLHARSDWTQSPICASCSQALPENRLQRTSSEMIAHG